MNKYFSIFGVIVLTTLLGCNNSSFSGSNKSGRKPGTGTGTGVPPGKPGPVDPKNLKYSGERSIESKTNHKIWIVTTSGTARWLEIEGDKVISTKTWTGIQGSGGTRTYVTEHGLIATRYPNMYFINPDITPQGPVTGADKTSIGANNRICVASYQKNNKSYMIAVWENGKYAEYLIEETSPFRPKWDSPTKKGQIPVLISGMIGSDWGYSCYIDQERKIFYSQMVGGKPHGIDLTTFNYVNASTAPNAGFVSTNIGTMTQASKGGSYSLSGDKKGNLLNGSSVYTMAYTEENDTVWVTANNKIGVFPSECFHTKKTCEGFAWYDYTVGPLSALKDGRVIGATRLTGDVYVFALKNSKDRKAGITGVKIASYSGEDPYMYTDFTGATLYVPNWESKFEVASFAGFDAKRPVERVFFQWTSAKEDKTTALWKDLKLEVRCFKTGATPPAFESVPVTKNASELIQIETKSCAAKDIQVIEAKVTQANDKSPLAMIDSLNFSVEQLPK